jgi:hypothetical protein
MRYSGTLLLVLALACLLPTAAPAQQHHQGSELATPTPGNPADPNAATAQGVALNAGANCTNNADLDITLTTVNATREAGITSLTTGAIMGQFEQSTGLANFSGTYVGYGQPITAQPAGTLIGSYAYVGETPPSAADTAEFFILYQCDTQAVLFSCFGPYGTCPQTADQVTAPTLPAVAMFLMAIVLVLTGMYFLRSRSMRQVI